MDGDVPPAYDDINEDLICSVCLSLFAFPVSLQCQHTFCSYCLRQIGERARSICCPLCKLNTPSEQARNVKNTHLESVLEKEHPDEYLRAKAERPMWTAPTRCRTAAATLAVAPSNGHDFHGLPREGADQDIPVQRPAGVSNICVAATVTILIVMILSAAHDADIRRNNKKRANEMQESVNHQHDGGPDSDGLAGDVYVTRLDFDVTRLDFGASGNFHREPSGTTGTSGSPCTPVHHEYHGVSSRPFGMDADSADLDTLSLIAVNSGVSTETPSGTTGSPCTPQVASYGACYVEEFRRCVRSECYDCIRMKGTWLPELCRDRALDDRAGSTGGAPGTSELNPEDSFSAYYHPTTDAKNQLARECLHGDPNDPIRGECCIGETCFECVETACNRVFSHMGNEMPLRWKKGKESF